MDPGPFRTRARRLRNPFRRLAVAGVAGVAWLALSAATATADDAPSSAAVPDGTGDVAATISTAPADELGATPAPITTGLPPGDLAPADLPPGDAQWAADAVPEPTLHAADPGLSVPGPVPAVPEPGLPVRDPMPPAADPAAPVPDPTPAADPVAPAAPVPDPTPAADPVAPAAPVPVSTPAADPAAPAAPVPAAPVPDPGGALPLGTPVSPLPGNTVSVPDHCCPSSVVAPPGPAVAAPEAAGSTPDVGIVQEAEAAREPLGSQARAESPPSYLRSLSFRPPGSAAILTPDRPFTAGVPGSVAADPAAPSVPDGGGTQAPSGPVGPSPWHEGTGLPAPNALPGAPGSGSGSGPSPTNPAGTAAWIPSLYFYLPTTGAGPIRGPLQHEYSAVSADPGSSPD
jgi:hypothetical protein